MKRTDIYARARLILKDNPQFSIKEIPEIIPITLLCKDMRLNYSTLSKRILDPNGFTIKDIKSFSRLLNLETLETITIFTSPQTTQD